MELITFENGMRVALEYKPDVRSAAVCFDIAAGNRFEAQTTAGISHFIEHMVFKGTASRTSEDIARESDLMGGQLNAFTAKEYTCFYSRALTEHIGRTLDLICDMLCNPSFDSEDIETERGVVLEEIGMYEDSPEDLCSDMLNALSHSGNPLSFNILGTRETVESFDADGLRRYMATTYSPERTVVSLCGNFDRQEALEILDRYFGSQKNKNNALKYEKTVISGGVTLASRDFEQTVVSFCVNGLDAFHPLRHALSFYSSILGGASASKINRRIREELGLAYSAYSFSSYYLGTGVFGITAGLAPKNQEKYFSEVAEILKNSPKLLTEDEIERTREQFKVGLVLANESLSSIAASAGKQLLLKGEYHDLDADLKKLRAVTLNDVKEAANTVNRFETVALSAVGKIENEDFYRSMLEKLKNH